MPTPPLLICSISASPDEAPTGDGAHILEQLMKRLQLEQPQTQDAPPKVLDDFSLKGIADLLQKMQSADNSMYVHIVWYTYMHTQLHTVCSERRVIVMTGAGISTGNRCSAVHGRPISFCCGLPPIMKHVKTPHSPQFLHGDIGRIYRTWKWDITLVSPLGMHNGCTLWNWK